MKIEIRIETELEIIAQFFYKHKKEKIILWIKNLGYDFGIGPKIIKKQFIEAD